MLAQLVTSTLKSMTEVKTQNADYPLGKTGLTGMKGLLRKSYRTLDGLNQTTVCDAY